MNREEVLALIAKKDAMVEELDRLLLSLDEQNVGMNRTLTTFDGFPRDDVDIPLIRSQRQKVLMLRNDINAALEEIRVALPGLLNAKAAPAEPEPPLKPFCYVAQVDTPSGLEVQDKILRFGRVDATNNNGLRALAGQLTNKPLRVKVERGGEVVDLELKVDGKLGARVMPL